MLQTTYTAANIHPALGTLDRTIHDSLDSWQTWSDRTFGTIQPHILVAVESMAYVIGWAVAMAYSYTRLACLNTWEAWLESAPQRALVAKVMGQHWATARRWFYMAYSAAAVAVVAGVLAGVYVLRQSPRWAGRAIAFALCVE
jgi:hypothetical protein